MTLSSPEHENHEQYMRRRIEEENKKNGVHIEYNNSRLTKEIKELTARVEKLEHKLKEYLDVARTNKIL
jgi:polyhydroxyalkanoate synthesis regulator phasin